MGLMSEKDIELQNIKVELSAMSSKDLVNEYLRQYEINMGVKPPADQFDQIMSEMYKIAVREAIETLTAHFKMEELMKEGLL